MCVCVLVHTQLLYNPFEVEVMILKGKIFNTEKSPHRTYIPPLIEWIEVEQEDCILYASQQGVEGEVPKDDEDTGGETEFAKSNGNAFFFDDPEEVDINF